MENRLRNAPETPIDEALAIARENSGQANLFYDAVLNAELLIPVQLSGSEAGSWKRVGPKEKFSPFFLTVAETRVMPAFDTLPRLKNWAGDRALDFIQLKGFLVVGLAGKNVALVLNPKTPWEHTLVPDIIARLRQAMKPVKPS